MEYMSLYLFAAVFILLLTGYPVAFTLAGTALIFTVIGEITGTFDPAFLEALPNRLYGIIGNQILMAVPLFVFMGVMLERSKIADELLTTMSRLFGRLRGGLGISVTLVGMLLAASTGIVGATVVTMGLLSLPTMLKRGYSPEIAAGTICASGTLGQIIPPSIILVMLGDVMTTAYQQAQLEMGVFSPKTVSVGDLFAGALIPGLLLVLLYVLYILGVAFLRPESVPAHQRDPDDAVSAGQVLKALAPPLILIFAVLGSILGGITNPTPAASANQPAARSVGTAFGTSRLAAGMARTPLAAVIPSHSPKPASAPMPAARRACMLTTTRTCSRGTTSRSRRRSEQPACRCESLVREQGRLSHRLPVGRPRWWRSGGLRQTDDGVPRQPPRPL